MTTLANLNGKLMPLSEVMVPALDRGFLFADAVYEVIRIHCGKLFLFEEHWQRLARSLDAIRITGVDLDRLRERLGETITAAGFPEAIAYLQVTRGAAATRAHAFPVAATPLELLWVQEFADPYSAMRTSGASVITRADLRWDRCDIKSTNLLANVLAMQAAREARCVESVLCLPDGSLLEGTHSSFFGVLDGQLRTAPTGPSILPGIVRQLILSLAAQAGMTVCEQALHRDDLPRVAELFLTGTTTEVLPVVSVDDKPIATGKPGPITQRLQAAYAETVRAFVQK